MSEAGFATGGNTVYEALGHELTKALAASGRTQISLEQAAGASDTTLARYFDGTVKQPRPSVLAGLASELHISYELLMTLAGYPLKVSPAEDAEARLLEVLRAYPWAAAAIHDLAAL